MLPDISKIDKTMFNGIDFTKLNQITFSLKNIFPPKQFSTITTYKIKVL